MRNFYSPLSKRPVYLSAPLLLLLSLLSGKITLAIHYNRIISRARVFPLSRNTVRSDATDRSRIKTVIYGRAHKRAPRVPPGCFSKCASRGQSQSYADARVLDTCVCVRVHVRMRIHAPGFDNIRKKYYLSRSRFCAS